MNKNKTQAPIGFEYAGRRKGYVSKAEIASKWRLKYGAEMPSRTLAKIIWESEDQVYFGSVENIRSALRYIEGKYGKKSITKIKGRSSHIMTEQRPYYLPPPAVEYDSTPVTLPKGTCLLLSDLQYPFYCEQSLRAAIDYALGWKKIDYILINGDWFDFYQISDFMKDPLQMRVHDELNGGCEILAEIIKLFKCPIYFKYGNHEERFDNSIMHKHPAMRGVPEFSLEACLLKRVPELEGKIITNKRTIKIGKLNVIHGHEWRRAVFNPVNPARGLWNRSFASALQGDSHQPSSHYEKNIEGSIFVTYSTGCLCNLKPLYMPNNKWLNGFAIVDVADNGEFIVHNKIIKNGKIY